MLRLRSKPRLPRLTGSGCRTRQLHDDGVHGYQRPLEFTLPDFTPQQLANRARNASLLRLVESYRRHAHRAALVDPLDLAKRPSVPALDPRRYGFSISEEAASKLREEFLSDARPDDMVSEPSDKFNVAGILDFPQGTLGAQEERTMDEIAARLAEVYCGGIAYEFMHLPSKHERRFLETMLEQSHAKPLDANEQLAHWELLTKSEGLDHFLAKRFPNVKRYGLEGGEAMMVVCATLLNEAKKEGVEDVVLGMPHRGRLNLLTQLLDLDMRVLIRKMRGLPTLPPSFPASQFTDDVLSHLFTTTPYTPPGSSDPLTVHLLPNPSHLETVTPVALGFARGLQVPFSDTDSLGSRVLSVSVHGDAAFGGQGVVAESLNLASLPHFNVGGTVHLVVNNQLGFTTASTQGRSSFYATDLAKMIAAPVLHVNGDRVDDVARAVKLALAYQRKFRKDVVIDLVVYRRRGHNELDEPAFTSPTMYNVIKDLPSVAKLYEEHLISKSVLSASDAASFRSSHLAQLDAAIPAADPSKFTPPELPMPRGWGDMRWPKEGEWEQPVETGVEEEVLREVGMRSVEIPSNITVHPRLVKMHIAKRVQSLEKGEGLDFATAEALAFGSLLLEGSHIRLCGQDSGRGTFSQRHAILADQASERVAVPLQTLTNRLPASAAAAKAGEVGTFEVVNSPLSEYAVVGFEQGVAWVSPKLLPIWEAQFGDFHNTAQVVLDTYLGSGETKWGMQSALTLLLPHGFDGAGPEHSSSRIERFLQLTNEPLTRSPFVPNMHLVNVTSAAQYFHLLRRQMRREYRKPLVVFSPKGILRLPAAASTLAEMGPGTSFQPVLTEHVADPSKVERVVLLSGKLYYELVKARQERGLDGKVVFIRLEEISPFPYAALSAALDPFRKTARSLIWAQDEPSNAGAYTFVAPRVQQVLPRGAKLRYVGREAMATVAPGVKSYFEEGRKRIEDDVFEGL
ncbi:dehydrogenase E1 and transketolase domain-containing protein 1 [Rhodotorula diobovata]|uniref:Dehydrogenase E1 and transketolase domain-containing protein 1 n=1 Tax=Rhodotorula diobovata TaxID=5288 RepID=A0A5C5FVK6_9BASI|nr:dehydrogenase E1 and transketolase domain-containing protein 1 [Rhodotorula diobovata]